MAWKLQFKRNETPFESKEAALEALKEQLSKGESGEIIISTFGEE